MAGSWEIMIWTKYANQLWREKTTNSIILRMFRFRRRRRRKEKKTQEILFSFWPMLVEVVVGWFECFFFVFLDAVKRLGFRAIMTYCTRIALLYCYNVLMWDFLFGRNGLFATTAFRLSPKIIIHLLHKVKPLNVDSGYLPHRLSPGYLPQIHLDNAWRSTKTGEKKSGSQITSDRLCVLPQNEVSILTVNCIKSSLACWLFGLFSLLISDKKFNH